ncbi:hypothetical protein O0L34_g5472 [Tuta absoluta]|nr:hypothetical protein O0L34_g5472 [Tuta absoluta]
MPAGSRPITLQKPKKQPNCNCELCSATVGKPNPTSRRTNEDYDDIPCIKQKRRRKHDCGINKNSWYQVPHEKEHTRLPRINEDVNDNSGSVTKQKGKEHGSRPPDSTAGRLQEIAEEDSTPCQPSRPCRNRKPDIIRRNKVAVRILSRQLSAVRSQARPCNSKYDSVELKPTALPSMHWAPAYSEARSQTPPHICRKKIRPPKEPELQFKDKARTCECELMANAIKADLAHYMSLSEQRDKINDSKTSSVTSEQ